MAAPKGHAKYGGRVKGVPNKVTVSLREAIMHAFDTVGGEAYLVKVARTNPTVFCMLLARILPLHVSASREGGLQSPASKISETLELLRNRLGPAQLIAQMEAQPKIGETAMDLLRSRFNDNMKPKAT